MPSRRTARIRAGARARQRGRPAPAPPRSAPLPGGPGCAARRTRGRADVPWSAASTAARPTSTSSAAASAGTLPRVVLLVICVLSFVFRGFNYGMEFAGGTQFQFTATGTSLTTGERRHRVHRRRRARGRGRRRRSAPAATRQIVVKTKALDAARSRTRVKSKLAAELGARRDQRRRLGRARAGVTTSPVKAIEGLIVFLIVVSLYISLRFQWRMAVGGIVALLHDLIDRRRHLLDRRLRGHPVDHRRPADHPRFLALRHRRGLRQGRRELQGPARPARG